MPYNPTTDETDGDPNTIYEDTSPHTKTGFMPDQDDITTYPSDQVRERDDKSVGKDHRS